MTATRIVARATLIAIFPAIVAAQEPEALIIDPGQTTITLHVGRAGVFAFAGHDHEVVVPAMQGRITLDRANVDRSTVSVTFEATALKVTGKGEPAEDVPEVQRVMLSDQVLDVKHHPTITFQSRQVSVVKQSANQMTLGITGDLTLHGVTRPLAVPVTVQLGADGLRATGRATVQQSLFGIRPVTAGAGTVRVKDEVDVVLSITARRP
jgi:polyisoprenoid-binding protein YceI